MTQAQILYGLAALVSFLYMIRIMKWETFILVPLCIITALFS